MAICKGMEVVCGGLIFAADYLKIRLILHSSKHPKTIAGEDGGYVSNKRKKFAA